MSDTAAVNSGSRPRKRRNSSKNRPSSGRPSSISQVMQVMGKLLGALLLLLTLNVFRDFPEFGYGLIALGVLYFSVLFFLPRLWLLVLPLAMVSFDLATYTGRFLFNEFDLLFLVTIAFGLISGKFSLSFLKAGWPVWLIGGYCAVVLSGFSAWGVFLSPPEAIGSNPYYLPEYGYKVIKGMLWALMLVPIWLSLLQQNRNKTLSWLVVGQCMAALMLGLVILWERGTLGVILSGTAWYHIVSSLLDLSSSYRTTGIFSDMHTGGEVVDGVILLLLPTVLYGISKGAGHAIRILSLVAFSSLAYCTTVGFTRATYVSFFVGIAAFILLYIVAHRRSETIGQGLPYGLLGLTVLIAFVAAFFSFFYAGSFGVASFAGLAVSAYVGGQLFRRNIWLAIFFWVITGSTFLMVAVNAHFDSRWVDRSGESALILVAVLLFFFLLGCFLFLQIIKYSEFNKLLLVAILIMLPSGFSIAFGGYKFNERMENVSKDMDTRVAHWSKVVESSNPGLVNKLFGNGVGSFPANYVYHFPDAVIDIGSYAVKQDGYDSYLSMGPGEDLAFGQRVAVQANKSYNLTLSVRSTQKGKIVAFLCERNLIFASNFMANCEAVSFRFNATKGGFVQLSEMLNTGGVGKRSWVSRWPTILYLKNFSKSEVVDIDKVSLSIQGDQLLKNSNFSRGTDHWFFYNDFSHLPWHMKNTYLQSWYNYGWIGFLLFVSLVMTVVLIALKGRGGSVFYVACATGVVAIGVFGIFGSPLDSSRVSWLFYFYIFAALLGPKEEGSNRKGFIENESVEEKNSRNRSSYSKSIHAVIQ